MGYDEFKGYVKEAVDKFLSLDKKPVKVVSNYDSDGLSAAAILTYALKRENIKFSLSIIKQLNNDIINELAYEDYYCYIFADLGSGAVSSLEKALKGKYVFILDHHKPEKKETEFIQVNPHLFNVDGSKEVSAAGVSYFFAKTLNDDNKDMAHIALVGAIGDVQEDKGFYGLNKEILKDAIDCNKIEIKNGLRMFGMQTRALHKVLAYSTDPYIPGVTGSEKNALRFLEELGINVKKGNQWKKLVNLDQEEMKKLVTGVVLRRLGSEKNPEDVLGPIYSLVEEDDESPMKDIREFSTLLNSCGRLRKPSLGIGACLGDKDIRKEAVNVLSEYKREIIKVLEWFYKNKEKFITEDGYVIVNAEDNVNDALIGTLISMVAKANVYKEDTVLLGMAHTLDGKTKISIRRAGFNKSEINLLEIIKTITEKVNGEAGGHPFYAAGALINQEREEEFIEIAKKVLREQVVA